MNISYEAPKNADVETIILRTLPKSWLSCPLRALRIDDIFNQERYQLFIYSPIRKKWVGTCKTFLKSP